MKVYQMNLNSNIKNLTTELVRYLEELLKEEEGFLYVNYPNIKVRDFPLVQPDIFLISLKYGVFSILVDDLTKDRIGETQKLNAMAETLDTKIYSDLLKDKSMRKDIRTLKCNVKTLVFVPNLEQKFESNVCVCNSKKGIGQEILNQSPNDSMTVEDAENILAILESTNVTIRPKDRNISFDDCTSKAFVLKDIEAQMARFDEQQRKATFSLQEGPLRIRGLAGSGKTIVLCLKAANLLVRHPEKKILYTFYTKSLYDYIIQLITRFYRSLTDGSIPDFENHMFVMHAWGGENVPGVYSYAAQMNQVPFVNYSEAYQKDPRQPFDYVCKDFIEKTSYQAKSLFDYILIDEGQDFEPSFYQLCNSIVKDHNLVWAYDELQNIFDIHIQDIKHTFKNDFDEAGLVMEDYGENNDIVLTRSYRNIKPILMWAICAGFGIYNRRLIQSLENNSHWADLGFQVLEGDCTKEENVLIGRDDSNSPLKIPESYTLNDFIEYFSYKDFNAEVRGVSEMIQKSIFEDGLRADDIVVICLDDLYAKNYFQLLTSLLKEAGISTYNLTTKNYIKGFQLEDAVTLSTVYKAKGNEAAMIFVMGCDVIENQKDFRNMRNRLFTTFTRAKLWLRMTGLNIEDHSIVRELKELERHNYQFEFFNKPAETLNRDFDEAHTERYNSANVRKDLESLAKEYNISVEQLFDVYHDKDIK